MITGRSEIIISADPKMKKIFEVAENVATSRASVLIMGESGTGKELLARFIHAKSPRANGAFVAINCAAVPEGLLESELFGHEKGAFTGAIQSKPGKFELAHDGTILLDELGELPLHLQSKLLRVLQEGEFERVGGTRPIKVNARVIATTNRNMADMVKNGQFREDLYYRLNVIPISIPGLRYRQKDLELLSQHFLEVSCDTNSRGGKVFSAQALQKILSYEWPGNVRELENVIERAVLLSNGPVIEESEIHITKSESHAHRTLGPGMTVFEAEKLLILNTLEYTGNNKTQAAKMLGISVRTLRNKLHEYMESFMSKIFDTTSQALEQSLNYRLQRHNLTSANIANAETPGYNAKKLDFEEALSRAIDLEGLGPSMSPNKDHIGLGAGSIGRSRVDVYDNPDINLANDKNTVDVEKEMATLAENTILYKAAVELINKKLAQTRYAITEGGR